MTISTIYAQFARDHLAAAREAKIDGDRNGAVARHVGIAREYMREHVRAVAVSIPLAMPAREVRSALHLLGWSQEGAADRLGVSHRMMRYYLSAGGELPPTAAELLRHLIEKHITTS